MRMDFKVAAAPLACLALWGCHGGTPKAPEGQVAAKVDGQEITQKQIDAELAGVQVPKDPKALDNARRQALQMIVARKLLAKAARDQGLDKTPEFAMREQAATDTLLAKALQDKLLASVPTPTPEEVDGYVRKNPDIFAERKVFDVDSIRFVPPPNSTIVKDILPLNTMAEVEAKLNSENIKFQRVTEPLDSVGQDPKQIAQLTKLPAGAVFMLPLKGAMSANSIKDTKIVPLEGDVAKRYATMLIQQQRARDVVQQSFSQIMAKANASHAVVFNKAFQPPAAAVNIKKANSSLP